jgi:tRNA pseudouridine55 synthase
VLVATEDWLRSMVEGGIFLVDKPEGITSFGVVARMRRLLGIKKVGHAGTLDPFATGLLVLCAGRSATKLIEQLMVGEKEYLATLQLGVETETLDGEGMVVRQTPVPFYEKERIDSCLAAFRGRQMQTPPAYSALKYKGKPLYYYARKGQAVFKEPREVEIRVLERTDQGEVSAEAGGCLSLRVVCSKGTYIRSLAADIGRELGCGAYLSKLRRLRSGCFALDNSLNWDDLSAEEALSRCLAKMISVEAACNLLQ